MRTGHANCVIVIVRTPVKNDMSNKCVKLELPQLIKIRFTTTTTIMMMNAETPKSKALKAQWPRRISVLTDSEKKLQNTRT